MSCKNALAQAGDGCLLDIIVVQGFAKRCRIRDLAVALLCAAVATQTWWLIAVAFVQGYAFAWVGHFFFEHNKPATFKYPWFSLMGDWKLWWDILTGKVRI